MCLFRRPPTGGSSRKFLRLKRSIFSFLLGCVFFFSWYISSLLSFLVSGFMHGPCIFSSLPFFSTNCIFYSFLDKELNNNSHSVAPYSVNSVLTYLCVGVSFILTFVPWCVCAVLVFRSRYHVFVRELHIFCAVFELHLWGQCQCGYTVQYTVTYSGWLGACVLTTSK